MKNKVPTKVTLNVWTEVDVSTWYRWSRTRRFVGYYRPQQQLRKGYVSQVSVCPYRGGVHPRGRQTPPMATAADGTHPTGMHPCFHCNRDTKFFLKKNNNFKNKWYYSQ